MNIYSLSKKKKIPKCENKKQEDKDYLLNINSYFKQNQINNINTYINNGNKSTKNESFKLNKRFFSANINRLPKIRYTVNDILLGDFKHNNKRIGSLKTIEKIKALKSFKKEKDKKEIEKKEKNIKKGKIFKNIACDIFQVLINIKRSFYKYS